MQQPSVTNSNSRTHMRLSPHGTVSLSWLYADADGIVVSDKAVHK